MTHPTTTSQQTHQEDLPPCLERPCLERPGTQITVPEMTRRPLPPSPEIETCKALIFSLESRRIVIVHRDGPIRIWSAEQLCRPIRKLTLGESVFYNGRQDTVKAMSVY